MDPITQLTQRQKDITYAIALLAFRLGETSANVTHDSKPEYLDAYDDALAEARALRRLIPQAGVPLPEANALDLALTKMIDRAITHDPRSHAARIMARRDLQQLEAAPTEAPA